MKHKQQEMLSPTKGEGWKEPTASYVGQDQGVAYTTPFLFVGTNEEYRNFCASTGFSDLDLHRMTSIGDLYGRNNTVCFIRSTRELVGFSFKASADLTDYLDSHNIRRISI